MGRDTDFPYGANASGSIADELAPCMEFQVCPRCRRGHGYCSETAAVLKVAREKGFEFFQESNSGDTAKDNDNMDLSKYKGSGKQGGGGKYKRRPFLKAGDIPKAGLVAKVIDFRTAPKQMEYSDFLCDVSAGTKEYTVGLREDSVLFSMMIDALGTNSDKWTGKKVKFVRGGPKGQYINVG